MLDTKLQYTTGLKYELGFTFNEEPFIKALKNVLGSHYSEYVKDILIKSVAECLDVSKPKVQSKWTTLTKSPGATEKEWKKQTKPIVMKPVAPRIAKARKL